MITTHASSSRWRQIAPREVEQVASCMVAMGATTTVGGMHSMQEAVRGMAAHIVRVALTTGTARLMQNLPA